MEKCSQIGQHAPIGQLSDGPQQKMKPQVQLHLNELETAVDILQSNLFELSAKLESVSRISLIGEAPTDPAAAGLCPLADSIFQIRCRIERLTSVVRDRIELLEI